MIELSKCMKNKFEQNNFFSSTLHAFGCAFPTSFPFWCDNKFVVKHDENMQKYLQ